MKSDLGLIPIYAKEHRKQSRMTILCILFSVFLVTVVFSMAEAGVRMEAERIQSKHGIEALQGLIKSTAAQNLFPIVAILFLLILMAGVLMIASSLNTNVAQRTRFFGMLRCLGMNKRQIVRFVRLEALNWCKLAIPMGVAAGTVATWGLCAILRFVVGEEFTEIPVFSVSLIGIVSGVIMGLAAVLLAASSPARRAAKVSPVIAMSGNGESIGKVSPIPTGSYHIEWTLGIHHALSSKKNLLLMTGSFALSIILFLSFSVMLDLVGYLMPQWSGTAELSISATDGGNAVPASLLWQLRGMEGVERVFARRSSLGIPAQAGGAALSSGSADLISMDAYDFDCLVKDKMLLKGSDVEKVSGSSRYALAVKDPKIPLQIGDTVTICGETLEIAGLLKCDLFSDNGEPTGPLTLVISDETFTRLTGIRDYALVLLQTTNAITDENVAAIRQAVGEQCELTDMRDQQTGSTYRAFLLFVYGFLLIIASVTVLNMMNSIAMSVSARAKQYGTMRAVGMDKQQLRQMITAEALTYAVCGGVAGCGFGLFLSRFLYRVLVTRHFSYALWQLPVVPLIVTVLLMLVTVFLSVYAPAKRVCDMAVVDAVQGM